MKCLYFGLVAALVAVGTACVKQGDGEQRPETETAAETASAAKVSKSVPKGWIEDFDLAKSQAKKDGKLVFVAVSGSDWCHWCVKLEEETYSRPEFVDKAKEKFVLVMIDNPRNAEILSDLARKQNRPLTEKLNVDGFPCGIVCRADGTEVGRISGYRPGGPAAYLQEMIAVSSAK